MRGKYFFFTTFVILFLFIISFVSAVNVGDDCDIPGEIDVTHYCNFLRVVELKSESGACSNNFECSGNSCVDGVCKATYQEIREHTNWLQDFFNRLVAFFVGQDTDCITDETSTCGPDTDEGICEYGIKTCVNGQWGDCDETNAIYPGDYSETCNGLDDDCEGTYMAGENEFSTGTEECFDDRIDNDCDFLVDCLDDDCSTDLFCEAQADCSGDWCVLITGNWDTGDEACEDVGLTCESTEQSPHNVQGGDPEWILAQDSSCDDSEMQSDWAYRAVCMGEEIVICYDGDGDGYGDPGSDACDNPELDCNNTNPAVNPGAYEDCDNQIDDNCNGYIDLDDADCDCLTGDTRNCGPDTNEGICEYGVQTCEDGQWGDCDETNAIYPDEEVCNDNGELDEDCDGLSNILDLDSCTGCEGQVETDCEDEVQLPCSPVECVFNEVGPSECIALPCNTWATDEATCMIVDGCEWMATPTIYCGNSAIDDVLNEECDMDNLTGLDCITYDPTIEFTGGQLMCNAPLTSNECTFNTTYCTTTYNETDPELSEVLEEITGLQAGTVVTTEIIMDIPEGITQPENSMFLGGFSINVNLQPLGIAEIFFKVNSSLVTIPNYVGLYRVEEDNSLVSLVTENLTEENEIQPFVAETDHFSDFLIFESEPYCGNDVAEVFDGEDCDGADLNGESCSILGFDTGEVTCDAECYLNLSGCYDEGTDDDDDDDDNDDTGDDDTGGGDNGGGGSSSSSSIKIVVYSPQMGIKYSKVQIPLEVGDSKRNAEYWTYSLNNGPKTIFTPNSTIVAKAGSNVLKVYAKERPARNYEATKLVTFLLVDNPEGYCGDNICDEGEDCSSCDSDCGLCALVPGGQSDETLSDTSSKSKAIVFAIIILVLLAGIGVVIYFIYKRAKGRSSGSATQQQGRPPAYTSSTGLDRRY